MLIVWGNESCTFAEMAITVKKLGGSSKSKMIFSFWGLREIVVSGQRAKFFPRIFLHLLNFYFREFHFEAFHFYPNAYHPLVRSIYVC